MDFKGIVQHLGKRSSAPRDVKLDTSLSCLNAKTEATAGETAELMFFNFFQLNLNFF